MFKHYYDKANCIEVFNAPDKDEYKLDNKVYELFRLIYELESNYSYNIIKKIFFTPVKYATDKFIFLSHVELWTPNHILKIKFGKITGDMTYNCIRYGGLDKITICRFESAGSLKTTEPIIYQKNGSDIIKIEDNNIIVTLKYASDIIDNIINDVKKKYLSK